MITVPIAIVVVIVIAGVTPTIAAVATAITAVAIAVVAATIIAAVAALVSDLHDAVKAFQTLLEVATLPNAQSAVVGAIEAFQAAEVFDLAKELLGLPPSVGAVPQSVLDSGVDVIELLAKPDPPAAIPILGIAVAVATAITATTVATTAITTTSVTAATVAATVASILGDSRSRQRENSCGNQANREFFHDFHLQLDGRPPQVEAMLTHPG